MRPLAEGVRQALVSDVRTWGADGVETGAFLLAAGDQAISVLALAGSAGITRGDDVFRVSGRALTELFVWAGDHELYVAAQAHSHGGRAFLSQTDLRHGFSVRGFTTTVIPYFSTPPEDPRLWGWWRYESKWQEIAAPSVTAVQTTIIHFDEGGIDEH